MEMDRYDHGVPSWADVGTPDIDSAVAFYTDLFGWDIPAGPAEAGGYRIAFLRGRTVCGIGPQMNPGPPVWTTYVNVDDADAVAALVKDNGGAVFAEPMDIMDVGRMAIFADPAGAVFGVWQPGTHPGAGIVNEPGSMCWNELVTTDVDGAKRFYGAVFGWGANDLGAGGPTPYTEWKLGDRSVGGMMAKTPEMPAEVPPFWGVYFAVADTDATLAKVNELGGGVVMGPMDIEPGRFAVVTDPTGAAFSVIALKEAIGGG
ncbi:MAG TPA: VOC family protein [Acidimicrobiia bacterium]|nr:VOC family protein [Acidimicrobiia bacterium]